jgi:Fur family ferric uptake transcriptional regulator
MTSDAAKLLREHGVHATGQRLAVLQAVSSSPHITAEQVISLAQTQLGAISRQAVYDALGVLVSRGIIRRIQPVGLPALYEDRVADNHHHVVCRICGEVADVDCAVGSTPCLVAANDMGYEIDEAEVAYWGRCPTCQEQGRTSTVFDTPTPRRRNHHRATSQQSQSTHQSN